jgi:hypothetical protein
MFMKEPQVGHKMAQMVVVAQGVLVTVKQALLEVLILLAVVAALMALLQQLVLVVLVVLPQEVVVVGLLATVLILARGAQVVMALFASTLGKELT